jgi:hypothetical protein
VTTPAKLAKKLTLSVLLLLGAGSCSVQNSTVDQSATDLPTLQGRFVESVPQEPIEAVEAFIGESNFYVSYETAEGLVYAGGNWAKWIDLAAHEPDADGSYPGPYLLPLEYRQRNRWPNIPESPIIPRLLNSEQWARFREQLFESILPKDEESRHALQ